MLLLAAGIRQWHKRDWNNRTEHTLNVCMGQKNVTPGLSNSQHRTKKHTGKLLLSEWFTSLLAKWQLKLQPRKSIRFSLCTLAIKYSDPPPEFIISQGEFSVWPRGLTLGYFDCLCFSCLSQSRKCQCFGPLWYFWNTTLTIRWTHQVGLVLPVVQNV